MITQEKVINCRRDIHQCSILRHLECRMSDIEKGSMPKVILLKDGSIEYIYSPDVVKEIKAIKKLILSRIDEIKVKWELL